MLLKCTPFFSDFHDDTKQLLLAVRDNLIEGLSGSFGVALIRAGESLSEAEKFLQRSHRSSNPNE